MAAAAGVFKKVIRKRESTYGVLAGTGSGQLLRRVKSDFSLSKDTYKSNEIRTDLQINDFRHGVRRVQGTLSGELSPGSYADEISSVVKRDYAAIAAITGASITIAGAGPTYTVTRAAGSFLTDGVKIGHVIQLSAGAFNAANSAKNLWVTALTATIATVLVLNGSALVAEGPIAASTVTVMGKVTYIPTTGHTNISYTYEHFFSDVAQTEVFTGVKYTKLDIQLPPTGLATIALSGVGKDLGQTGTAQYFVSPTALLTTGVVAAVNGLVQVGGVTQATITGMQLTVDPMTSGDPVVGSNTVPQQFVGPVEVSGQLTMQFVDAVARDLFVNETETTVMLVLTADNTANSAFIGITMARVKLGGAAKDDGTGSIVQTMPFQALFNNTGGAGISSEQTTITFQDSAAP